MTDNYEDKFHADPIRVKEAWATFNTYWDGLSPEERDTLNNKEVEIIISHNGKSELQRYFRSVKESSE